MSKTDKTAPYDVKVFFYPRFLEEYHDHREGPCDLPPKPRNCKDTGYQFFHGGKRNDDETQCYWCASYTQFWRDPMSNCPCPMCKRYAYEEPPSRRERREGRRYCQDGWREEY